MLRKYASWQKNKKYIRYTKKDKDILKIKREDVIKNGVIYKLFSLQKTLTSLLKKTGVSIVKAHHHNRHRYTQKEEVRVHTLYHT